ncbi:MAG: biotin-dependent carboxyltransferase family protein [Hyphomicrobiaceae bacterium]|nr:biotin-dependent carboxyltransferase family protein [Hyphomicrobiaceae bacterium]
MKPALRVLAPGLLTTVQDQGRTGYQSLGVPVSGAMDGVSFAAANAIVGNPPQAAALEIAYQGPALEVEARSVRVAYAGPEAAIEIVTPAGEARRLPRLHSARLLAGERLRIGPLVGSAVGYLAIEGGIDVPLVLGSRSTLIRAAIGGLAGRQLAAGDRLPLAQQEVEERAEQCLPSLDLSPPERFRVVLGPQDDYFTAQGIETLLTATYTVTQHADRMGMRLDGPRLAHALGSDIVSDGIAPGTIQVPGNGLPIVLLADRQTTGGYPKIATVISADLAPLGRLRPGATVRFEKVSVGEAQGIRREQARMISGFAARLAPVAPSVSIDVGRLHGVNLLSGWVDAHE